MTRRTLIRGFVVLITLFMGVTVATSSAPALGAQGVSPQPRRIISLVPAVTEMLFAIDAGDQVVGVSSFDHYPAAVETRARVGALIDPDFERIISLTPDLVVVYGSQADLIERLGRVRIPIFNYRHAGLADINTTIEQLGDRIGRGTEARREIARITRELDEVRRQVAGKPRPKTVLLFGRELGSLRGMFASAGLGFMHDLLDLAGGADVFDDVKRQSLQATTEVMIARAPEVVIEAYPTEGWTPEKIAKEREVWRGLPMLPAVRTGRIYILADDALLVPGPRVTVAARLLAKALHP